MQVNNKTLLILLSLRKSKVSGSESAGPRRTITKVDKDKPDKHKSFPLRWHY